MKQILILLVASFFAVSYAQSSFAGGHDIYGPWPVTVKGYIGDKTNSTSYSGQMARHVLHDSLKSLSSKGDAEAMMSYFTGSENDLAIVAPSSKGDFVFKQTSINEISKGKNLSGKTFKGLINGWPGGMTGPEVLEFLINKAAQVEGGYDASTGYNYPQLISILMKNLHQMLSQIINLIKMVLTTLVKSMFGMKLGVIGVQQHML